MRAGLSEKETKIIFMSGKIFVYDELIELYQKMHAEDPSKGYDKKALEIFERKQGRVFLEEMGKSGARDFAGLPGAVKDSETDLENRMEKARATLRRHARRARTSRTRRVFKPWKLILQQLRADYHTLQEEIRTKPPGLLCPEASGAGRPRRYPGEDA